jgi:hypothetical protein
VVTLFTVQRYTMFFLLATLAVIVGYRLLTGKIITKGLLKDKQGKSGGKISPGRLQMLLATILVAVYFVTQVLQSEKLPELPQEFLLALGASHLFYLGGKTYAVVARKLELALNKIAGRMNQ